MKTTCRIKTKSFPVLIMHGNEVMIRGKFDYLFKNETLIRRKKVLYKL